MDSFGTAKKKKKSIIFTFTRVEDRLKELQMLFGHVLTLTWKSSLARKTIYVVKYMKSYILNNASLKIGDNYKIYDKYDF